MFDRPQLVYNTVQSVFLLTASYRDRRCEPCERLITTDRANYAQKLSLMNGLTESL